ncbi:SCO2400 family protein, partial [Streptomyces californicus]
MDYCHPCRRHLNGALACAGCGTPAQALSPWASSEVTGVTEATGPTPDGANGAYGTASQFDARGGKVHDALASAQTGWVT